MSGRSSAKRTTVEREELAFLRGYLKNLKNQLSVQANHVDRMKCEMTLLVAEMKLTEKKLQREKRCFQGLRKDLTSLTKKAQQNNNAILVIIAKSYKASDPAKYLRAALREFVIQQRPEARKPREQEETSEQQ